MLANRSGMLTVKPGNGAAGFGVDLAQLVQLKPARSKGGSNFVCQRFFVQCAIQHGCVCHPRYGVREDCSKCQVIDSAEIDTAAADGVEKTNQLFVVKFV